MPEQQDPSQTDLRSPFERRLDRALALACSALFWERLWPVAYRVLMVGGLFLALSWLGLWWILPSWLRWIGVVAFLGALAYEAWPGLKLRWPTRAEGIARLEEVGHYRHHPLAALKDHLVTDKNDPTVCALWRAHRARALKALTALKPGWPHPQAFRNDPWALRVIVALLLVVGFGVSTGERGMRTVSAFVGSGASDTLIGRIDAWVTPPSYTRRPPIFLTGDMGSARDPKAIVTVPEGSVVVVRAQGESRDLGVVSLTGGTEMAIVPEVSQDPTVASDAPLEHRITLASSGDVEVRRGGDVVDRWRFSVEPDADPVIDFLEEPEPQLSGTLKLAYEVSDDYGVMSARAEIEPTSDATTIAGASSAEPHPLYEAPVFPLSLPHRRAREGQGETFKNLTSHPWAGSKVRLTLVAKDEAGQEGRSATKTITLPERRFTKPLARAIVEQRCNLALDANLQPQVIDAVDMLMLVPDEFMESPKSYLGMKFVYARLNSAKSDKELKEASDLMWELALSIEDGDLSVAERELRQAQERLREALERGASDEEIAKLTQELREALQRYMQALAEQLKNNPQVMQPMDTNAQMLRSHDLEEMLRRIEELAKNGARDAVRDLLAQMQRMMENLQTGRMQQMQQSRQSREMMKMLGELADTIRRQQELMDQTHRQGQQMTPEEFTEALKRLQEGQNELAQRLQELMDQMAKNGMPKPGELGEAGKSMDRAGKALGQGRPGDAVGNQADALKELRDGAGKLGEQMMGPGGPRGLMGREDNCNEDPLGRRPSHTDMPPDGRGPKVPGDIDIQRAGRILEELRRRFSDPNRPQLELDYLERLLKRE
ncbi:TIGR02302 family protein [Breoghania sp.]|uniref:TIGR02302 family protein n=1 Tax=Breoghania sp. TaxID=2065378 RepID=UPI00260AF78E|nr:TIGR02302 family protein [Breoghania sp.]MDJ0930624.1 TIGR02302 family protein [Breoghania sp.]